MKGMTSHFHNELFYCSTLAWILFESHLTSLYKQYIHFLRYLYVRWGTDMSKFVVLTGECGDTDYEGMLGGVHKTVILKGVGCEARKLHTNRSYPLEHVVPSNSPLAVECEGCKSNDINVSLKKLGIFKC